MTKKAKPGNDMLADGRLHLVLAGTGSPDTFLSRAQTCNAVIVNGCFVLIDAGMAQHEK
ncbi:MAG: hypothetical protein ACTSW4_05545 [Candidatus Ranarchaeia archaeon]